MASSLASRYALDERWKSPSLVISIRAVCVVQPKSSAHVVMVYPALTTS